MALSYFNEAVGGVQQLWVSDGTSLGTHVVATFGAGAISDLTTIGARVFFAVNSGGNGQELWTSDGTTAGTVMVKDIAPGATSSSPADLTNVTACSISRPTTARMALSYGDRTGPPPEPLWSRTSRL